jgi:hypothetical protein
MYGFHKRVEGYLKFPSPGDTISGQAPWQKGPFFATNPIDYQRTTPYNDLHLPPGNGKVSESNDKHA